MPKEPCQPNNRWYTSGMAKQPNIFTTTQPVEWQEAARTEAKRRGLTTSEWVGEAILAYLPPKVRAKLPTRPPAHRPPAEKTS
jgi:hypothetical protein